MCATPSPPSSTFAWFPPRPCAAKVSMSNAVMYHNDFDVAPGQGLAPTCLNLGSNIVFVQFVQERERERYNQI